jgi:hypothetical protein
LCVYEDILVGVGKTVVEEGLEYDPGAAAEGKGLGKGFGMPEFQELFAGCAFVFAGTRELGKVQRQEAEAECVDGVDAFGAAGGSVELTGVAFDIFFLTIDVAGDAKSQFEIVLRGVLLAIVVDHLAHIIEAPLSIPTVAFDRISY